MSIARDCPSCMNGKHEHHDPTHGLRRNVIGGQYCACSGDCAERFAAMGVEFARLLETATPTDDAAQAGTGGGA